MTWSVYLAWAVGVAMGAGHVEHAQEGQKRASEDLGGSE